MEPVETIHPAAARDALPIQHPGYHNNSWAC